MGMVNSKTLWTIGFGVSGALYLLYGRQIMKRFRSWNGGRFSDGDNKPIRGLRNVGSTCYLNAVLQALSACTYFSAWLAVRDDLNKCDFPPRLHHPVQYAGFDYPMIAVLYRAILVINRVIGNDDNDCDLMSKVPRDIISTLHHLNYKFIVTNQEQDTFECLQHLLTVLQNEVVCSTVRRQKGSLECIMDEDDASEVSGELISVSEIESEVPNPPSASVSANVSDATNLNSSQGPRLSISNEASSVSGGVGSGWDVLYDAKKAMNGIYSKRKASSNDINYIPMAPKFPFRGMTANVLQCLQCLHKMPVKFETFESLTLLLPYVSAVSNFQLNIRSLLNELQKPVIVTQVNCDGCSKKQGKPTKSAFSKTLYFARLPSILVFHILQSEWRSGDGLRKRHEFVRYNERMNVADLNHWRKAFDKKKEPEPGGGNADADAGGSGDAQKIEPEKSQPEKENIFYDLKAFVAHSGDADSGHFITCRRVPDTPANVGNCRWAHVSDECVSELQNSEPFKFKPYLLFYEKSSKRNYTQGSSLTSTSALHH